MWRTRAAVALLALSAAAALGAQCYSPSSLEFTSENGRININGAEFKLKAINWFGFETTNNVFHGLWANDYKAVLDIVKNNGFNALRVPFWLGLALNDANPNSVTTYGMNEDLVGKTSLQILDIIVKAAAERGILIMLDLHSFEQGTFAGDGKWYDDKHPESTVLAMWDKLVARYKDQWNVFAFDLKNEPHQCTWATGNAATDWDSAIVRIGEHIFKQPGGSRFLVFGEGIGHTDKCGPACFWGENFAVAKSNPVKFSTPAYQKKFVYSPHVYGPNVDPQKTYWNAANFPDNMPEIWDAHFGLVAKQTGNAVVIGEWGGNPDATTSNGKWMSKLVDYLKQRDIAGTFFWCLNPNSGDTGGVMSNDWKSVDSGRLDLLKRLQPAPTKITLEGGKVCFDTTGGVEPQPHSSAVQPHSSAHSSAVKPQPHSSAAHHSSSPAASSKGQHQQDSFDVGAGAAVVPALAVAAAVAAML
eukprot:m51a1_g9790 putative cellulase (472) ;mRNA; r:1749423-1751101